MTRAYVILKASPGAITDRHKRGPTLLSGARFNRVESGDTQILVEQLAPREVLEFRSDPAVAAVAPIMPVRLIAPVAAAASNEAEHSEHPTPTPVTWGVHAVRADDSPFDGSGIKVAVLDTGIDATHRAFQGMTLIEQDFSGDSNGDGHGHGTHCAGTIFGRDVDGTRIGVARGVTTALIGKVLRNNGNGTSAAIFRAIQWALDQDARVISMSLGFDFPGLVKELVDEAWPVELATSVALEAYRDNLRMVDALMDVVRARRVFDGGTVIIAAAGNESRRDVRPDFEIAVSVPAAAFGIVSVGALQITPSGQLRVADFSNKLPEISAPGVGIVSAKLKGDLEPLSGTSMAAPHVAGVAALWWQALKSARQPATSSTVVAKLLAEARTDVFVPEVNVFNRGVGLVIAPG